MRRPSAQVILGATAISAWLWVIARACVQSITIDEADTYLVWVARPDPSYWSPATNNHLLNSVLMRLFTGLFGMSHLSVRAPALLGAGTYIAMAYRLCRRIAPDLRLGLPLLICLVYNPFVMDHMVAARGYSLAMAFLMVALAVAAEGRFDNRACAVCSVCAALSFAANAAFALVNAALLAAVFLCANRGMHGVRERWRRLSACVVPGLVVTFFLTIHEVLHFPTGELWYGSRNLKEMFRTVRDSTLYRLNPQIVNPSLMQALEFLTPWLVPAVLALAAWQFRRRQPAFAYLLVGVLAAAILGHWILLKRFHILLPKDRTAIWIVPLVTLAVGVVSVNRRVLTVGLSVLSIYFVLCLRLEYFKEWSWDADLQEIYPVLAWYNHTYGVKEVESNWQYGSGLNFYRLESGSETFGEIPSPVQLRTGYRIYVLNYPFDEDFLKRQHLRVVYHGRTTDAVVAVDESVETQVTVN